MSLSKVVAAIAAGACAVLLASSANAFEITFDENGTGCVQNVDHVCTGPLTSTRAADPTGRVAGLVLIYTLPSPVVEGDVGIAEFGTTDRSDFYGR